MTYEEFKAAGKDGVYRADLDEWFIEGEDPPKVGSNQLLDMSQAAAPVAATPVAESPPVSDEKPLTKTGAKK